MNRKLLGLLALIGWSCSMEEPEPSYSPDAAVSNSETPDGASQDDGGEIIPDGEGAVDAGEPIDAGPPALQLSIDVQKQKSEDGQLCVAVYSSADGFPDEDEKAFYRGCVSMASRPLLVPGLTEGNTYGFSVFHDANGNSNLDMTNFLGFELPSESYGFSNNAQGSFGPPSWDDSKFVFSPATASPVIQLSNPL